MLILKKLSIGLNEYNEIIRKWKNIEIYIFKEVIWFLYVNIINYIKSLIKYKVLLKYKN